MGFSGYAVLDGVPLLLLPSGPQEAENLIKSSGAYSTDPGANAGPIQVQNRRALSFNLTTHLSINTAPLIKKHGYAWRSLAFIDNYIPPTAKLILANGEGYEGQAYIETITVGAQVEQLAAVTFGITFWIWQEVRSTEPTPKQALAVNPTDPANRPIPYWQTIPESTCMGAEAIPQSWNLSLNHNWQYHTFQTASLVPPNPALVYPGMLEAKFDVTWLARRNDRPRNVGQATIKLGTNPEVLKITLPKLIRDPQLTPQGVGAANDPIRWSASYYLSESIPY
jgi:hypothetical protein